MKKKLLKIKNKLGKRFSKFIKKIKNRINKLKKKLVNDKKKKYKKEKKLDYRCLSVSQIENELRKTRYNEKYFKILRSTIYSLIIIISIGLIVATFIMPVFQISTDSLNDYNNGDVVISIKTKNINNGDVIAFYHGNKILIKRVVATSGSWVVINDKEILVDGKLLDNININNIDEIPYNIEIPYQVPDGSWFVLSDDIEDMVDSRNSEIGCVTKENIIGKILFRIWPLNK